MEFVNGQNQLARINDPDGFTFVRSGEGKDYPIIAKIESDDFFYYENSLNDWLKVRAIKWNSNGDQIEGFMHKSKVQPIESLDIKTKQKLFKKVLSKQKSNAELFQKSCNSNDTTGYYKIIHSLEEYDDTRYSPILSCLPNYLCLSKDTILLQLFFATLWADKGSANELQSEAIGNCYVCAPNFILGQAKWITNKEQQILIFDLIEWGLLNHFNVNEDSISQNKQFNRLKKLLDANK